ncbi:unnamed protein product, partial [marine sediment metagenome]
MDAIQLFSRHNLLEGSHIWVSFYLDEIVAIRDIDWTKLMRYFSIPEDIKNIDFTKIKFDKQTRLLKYG